MDQPGAPVRLRPPTCSSTAAAKSARQRPPLPALKSLGQNHEEANVPEPCPGTQCRTRPGGAVHLVSGRFRRWVVFWQPPGAQGPIALQLVFVRICERDTFGYRSRV